MKMIGKVTWFNDAKGFGFIQTEELKGDVFVHYSHIVTNGFKTLAEGDKVTFDLFLGARDLSAHNVVKIASGLNMENEQCDHYDHEDGYCLQCGEDLTEYLVGRAEHYSDIRDDR